MSACPWCGYTSGHEPLCLGAVEIEFTPATAKREAHRAIQPAAGTLRQRVLEVVAASRGLTAEEIESATGLTGNTVRPRLVELREAGLVAPSGEARTTRSGRRATVWVAA